MTIDLTNWRQFPHSRWAFSNIDQLLPVATIERGPSVSRLERGAALDIASVTLEGHGNISAAEALDRTNADALLVMRNGFIIAEHYWNDCTDISRHLVFSVSKSITSALAGILVGRDLLSPTDRVSLFVPEVAGSAYADCTVRHLLDMTVDITFEEDYLDPNGDIARYRAAVGWDLPKVVESDDGLRDYLCRLRRNDGQHGDRFHYVSPNTDMLGWVLERATMDQYADLLSRHIWQPIGAEADAFVATDPYGVQRPAGGVCASLRDLGRFGEMMRRRGRVGDRQVVPAGWIDDIVQNGDRQAWARGEFFDGLPKGCYRSKWYVTGEVPGAYCAIGIHGQWIYIDPAAGTVIVKLSSQPIPSDADVDRMELDIFRSLAAAR
ncbi:serine hydrolase domain-containing protein [Oryzibacter oryziterrae]|uniref:serine hydrolase domain-containing protein n=1 Tax=Oryzibacter oryziterrae TaxID=2766474 RepID=UPI001F1C9F73|nr:serine hydrolase [Oryzibacter oryziterrae]